MPRTLVPTPWPDYGPGWWYGGRRTLSPSRCSPPGTSVVYWLIAADTTPLYIGSSCNLHPRLVAHSKEKPWWRFYDAKECSDRETAYWMEAREIRASRPRLNRDLSVGGRARLAPPFPEPSGPTLAVPPDGPPSCGHDPALLGCCDYDSPAFHAQFQEDLDRYYNAS